jgi:23S rRNA (pseudouridine1915-N3)-methyltransferase
MKIIILAVGKEKDFAGYELVTEYTSRIGHYLPIEWVYVPASDIQEEGTRILKVLDGQSGGSHVVMLDEKGKEQGSAQFSTFIQSRMNEGLRSLVFMIGGAHGFSEPVRERAQTKLALSQLTFPHQLVRLILAEQIYRACTIMKGEKYHHE